MYQIRIPAKTLAVINKVFPGFSWSAQTIVRVVPKLGRESFPKSLTIFHSPIFYHSASGISMEELPHFEKASPLAYNVRKLYLRTYFVLEINRT